MVVSKMQTFAFKGYYLDNANFERIKGGLPSSIIVGIKNLNLDSETNVFSIYCYIKGIDENKAERQNIVYKIDFKVTDSKFIADYIANYQASPEKMTADTQDIIKQMVRVAFPFIRQAYANLSTDSAGSIILPIFDTDLLYKNAMQFNKNMPKPLKKISKTKPSKK